MPDPIRSTLAVLLHADVVGSTRLVQSGEVQAHTSMRQAFTELGEAVAARNGVVHEIRGDALVAEFPRASDAVLAALAFQEDRRLGAATKPEGQPSLRIGIAMGEVVIADGTITGAGVVLAQRLEQLAPAGGVCVSEAVREATPSHLPCHIESLGPQRLKGFETAVSAHLLSVATDTALPRPDVLPGAPSRRHWPRPAVGLLLIAALGIATLLALRAWDALVPNAAQSPRATVAVTPFADRQPGGDDAYLGAGIAEDIATDLAGIDALRVVYHPAAGPRQDPPPTPRQVAQARAVRYVVSGSIRRTPERLRISAQLYDAQGDDVLWAARLDGAVDDIFDFQDQITGAVVTAVSKALGASLGSVAPRRYTPNPDAYDLYVQGRAQRIPPTVENLAAAAHLFERAIAVDPGFAGGYAGAAYTNILRYGSCFDDCTRLIVTAEEQALAAVRVDDTFGPAYGSLAEVLYRRGDFARSREAAERAVELSPSDALMLAPLGRVVGHGGDPHKGLDLTRAAHQMSPDSLPMLFYLGALYHLSGQFDKAIDALTRHREQLGGRVVPAPTAQLVAALAQAGRVDDARALLARLLAQVPRLDVAAVLRSFTFALKTDEAAFVEALVSAGLHRHRGAD